MAKLPRLWLAAKEEFIYGNRKIINNKKLRSKRIARSDLKVKSRDASRIAKSFDSGNVTKSSKNCSENKKILVRRSFSCQD